MLYYYMICYCTKADNRLGDAGAACLAAALLGAAGRRASELRYLDLGWNGIDVMCIIIIISISSSSSTCYVVRSSN